MADKDLHIGLVQTDYGEWIEAADPWSAPVRFDYTLKANGTFLGCLNQRYTLHLPEVQSAIRTALGGYVVASYFEHPVYGEAYVGQIVRDPEAVLKAFGWQPGKA